MIALIVGTLKLPWSGSGAVLAGKRDQFAKHVEIRPEIFTDQLRLAL